MSIASSSTLSVCVAIRLVRSRHSVGAVAGGRTGLTYTPSSNSFLLISSVRSAS